MSDMKSEFLGYADMPAGAVSMTVQEAEKEYVAKIHILPEILNELSFVINKNCLELKLKRRIIRKIRHEPTGTCYEEKINK